MCVYLCDFPPFRFVFVHETVVRYNFRVRSFVVVVVFSFFFFALAIIAQTQLGTLNDSRSYTYICIIYPLYMSINLHQKEHIHSYAYNKIDCKRED